MQSCGWKTPKRWKLVKEYFRSRYLSRMTSWNYRFSYHTKWRREKKRVSWVEFLRKHTISLQMFPKRKHCRKINLNFKCDGIWNSYLLSNLIVLRDIDRLLFRHLIFPVQSFNNTMSSGKIGNCVSRKKECFNVVMCHTYCY